jgi:hypothetical protein
MQSSLTYCSLSLGSHRQHAPKEKKKKGSRLWYVLIRSREYLDRMFFDYFKRCIEEEEMSMATGCRG